MKKIFISYSWDSDEHRLWVKNLADSLEQHQAIHVIWDGYDLDSLKDKNHYMESGIYEADNILVVTTEKYKNKADNRSGGVGIETFLSTAEHWNNLQEKGGTKIIQIKREDNSIPRYLSGHLYLDFTDDVYFTKRVQELLKLINGTNLYERPSKASTPIIRKSYELTKASDIIGMASKNRSQIISLQEGTDHSGSNKIKFEMWQTKTPTSENSYIVALHHNITISQTLNRIAEEIIKRKLKVDDITILRPREKSKSTASLHDILIEKGYTQFSSSEMTFDNYIWDYCIDSDFKHAEAPDIIEFYTNQDIIYENEKVSDTAVEYLKNELTSQSEFCASIIIGSGGIGKTSLCLSLANKLINEEVSKHVTVFIRSEDIRKHLEKNNISTATINSIYDIYELQAKYLGHSNIFDKNTFELSILTGNIIIIIDGLDELSSLFGDKFNIIEFLSSINKLHSELGSTRILLTSRESSFLSKDTLSDFNIKEYKLLGFDINKCQKYLNKRFNYYPDKDEIVAKILKLIDTCALSGGDRVIPFFVDVLSTIYDDNIRGGGENIDILLNNDPLPYYSLNNLNDHLIAAIFEREKKRHRFSISYTEMIELFKLLNQEIGESWPLAEVEEMIALIYDRQGEHIFECIKKNPLVTVNSKIIKYKYDFLHSYFNSLSLFELMESSRKSDNLPVVLAKANKDSYEFRELIKYYENDAARFIETAKEIISSLRVTPNSTTQEGKKENRVQTERIISSIENLILMCHHIKSSKRDEFSQDIRYIYDADNSKNINGLYIKGDLPAFNFARLSITNSKFRNYPKFLESNFEDSKFIYTEFSNCHNDRVISSTFLKADIDKNTCIMGDLENAVEMLNDKSKRNDELLLSEADKFLSSFYRNRFRENNAVHINFSNHFNGLRKKNLSKLIANSYLRIKVEKEVDVFYEIDDSFKPSVRKFLNDGLKDSKMKDFLHFVSQ
ncbi:TIR domain-containing protein [Plesiomonas shigelloides]|uniref:toll/interleukin-1 receptor domain-containing protein n=1 Tax=Plesiomonas shigelloides TaxID=703 RepID=UPI0012614D90|nr:toll/interleukin-1 receptor domain-containing protein [Plesiomonas shigelloides]KAB7702943.1 TIR domain-containing protein [Plesiomonas shigelloides]